VSGAQASAPAAIELRSKDSGICEGDSLNKQLELVGAKQSKQWHGFSCELPHFRFSNPQTPSSTKALYTRLPLETISNIECEFNAPSAPQFYIQTEGRSQGLAAPQTSSDKSGSKE
jgi:hypothetical protein